MSKPTGDLWFLEGKDSTLPSNREKADSVEVQARTESDAATSAALPDVLRFFSVPVRCSSNCPGDCPTLQLFVKSSFFSSKEKEYRLQRLQDGWAFPSHSSAKSLASYFRCTIVTSDNSRPILTLSNLRIQRDAKKSRSHSVHGFLRRDSDDPYCFYLASNCIGTADFCVSHGAHRWTISTRWVKEPSAAPNVQSGQSNQLSPTTNTGVLTVPIIPDFPATLPPPSKRLKLVETNVSVEAGTDLFRSFFVTISRDNPIYGVIDPQDPNFFAGVSVQEDTPQHLELGARFNSLSLLFNISKLDGVYYFSVAVSTEAPLEWILPKQLSLLIHRSFLPMHLNVADAIMVQVSKGGIVDWGDTRQLEVGREREFVFGQELASLEALGPKRNRISRCQNRALALFLDEHNNLILEHNCSNGCAWRASEVCWPLLSGPHKIRYAGQTFYINVSTTTRHF